MKRVFNVSLIAGLLALGMAAQAEAVPSLQIIGCQGATCVVGAVQSWGPVNFTSVTVGDYTVSGSGAAVESAGQSNVQQTTINVSRTATSNGYPVGRLRHRDELRPAKPSGLARLSTHGATYTNVGGGASTAASVGFQGW